LSRPSSNSRRRILFLTATRADFGKLKSLIRAVASRPDDFEVRIAVTGMHLSSLHGSTHIEVQDSFPSLEHALFQNHNSNDTMDLALANTITGLSRVVDEFEPDLLIVHGDRIEALAGSICGALRNVLVAHIEGGEVSGTIDELMRHATSKMSHIHFVSHERAKELLIQMGELPNSIEVIGSPDLDLMRSENLVSIGEAKKRYEIDFETFVLVLLHPVTTDLEETSRNAKLIRDFIGERQNLNFIVIGPNNDYGSRIIWDELSKLEDMDHVKFFPSIRFEYFVSLLNSCEFILGNSSAGVREAPFLGIPCINIGTRQSGRSLSKLVRHVNPVSLEALMQSLDEIALLERSPEGTFGDGNSSEAFLSYLLKGSWSTISVQKQFQILD